jgi:SpoVK/Ycf46/Vps4 family AAA+-type ATPase
LDALAVEGSRLTPGYVAADLLLLARETALNVSTTDKTQSSWESELKTAVAKMKPASLRSGFGIVTTEPISLNQLGGLDDIKLKLQIAIQWPLSHPEAFSKLGIPRPKGE